LPTWSERSRTPDGFPRCIIVAEVAQAHDGSLGTAHAFVDAIARAGADAVKFQTHVAAAESTRDEPWRVRFSRQDASRYDYWRRMEFTEPQWHGLKEHAGQAGLLFLSSPFSLEAVDLLERVGVAAWKIASGETGNRAMVERVADSGLPVVLSSGMSDWSELDAAVRTVRASGTTPTVLQCTTAYPCPPEKVGLNVIEVLRDRYGCPVGLSDHSGTVFPGLAATMLGIAVLEVHVTLSREMFGPDVTASVTTGELAELVRGVRWIEAMLAHPVDKDAIAAELTPLRAAFTKSVATRHALARGTILMAEHLTLKKPGTGIPEARMPLLVGRRLARDVTADVLISEGDLEHSDR
jgi:N-acetylneuraminate synthase